MVQSSNNEKEAFSERLHSSIDYATGATKRHGRAKWLSDNLPFKITPKGTGRWLNAETMPSRENMAPLAELLGVSKAWLGDGEGEMLGSEALAAEKRLGLPRGSISHNEPLTLENESASDLMQVIIQNLHLFSDEQKKDLLRAISLTL